jgi:glycosyltransferase involved in cell wall biosynthesis
VKLAYLSAEYPAISHTFIMREVEALRRRGAEVDTFTIRRTPPERLLSAADRAADRDTFAVLPPRWGQLAAAHARIARRSPSAYGRALRLSLRIGPRGARNRLWQLFYFAEAVLVARELERRGIDHVHAHFVNVASSVALLAAALRGPGTTWSFTMHGPVEFDNVDHWAIAEKVRRADFVVCISDFCRAQVMKLVEPAHWDKLTVVHCGVEPAAYALSTANGTVPAHVVSVGRLVPMKGFSLLVSAVAALAREGRPVRLTVVGDGPDRAMLEGQAARLGIGGAVTFTGALGAEAVTGLLASATVFCLPSFAEGVPVVLMEAMAAGVPVISTEVMGIPELVRDGESGLLVAPGREDQLAGALRRLLDEPETRARLGRAGRETVEREFDVDRSAAQLLARFAAA